MKLSLAATYIMGCLTYHPMHGYALMHEISWLGEQIGPATMYRTLAELQGCGLIESVPGHERQTIYRLTSDGRKAIVEKINTLSRLVEAVEAQTSNDAPDDGKNANGVKS
jgi:DNA-binding PadR family transcriptional regulator